MRKDHLRHLSVYTHPQPSTTGTLHTEKPSQQSVTGPETFIPGGTQGRGEQIVQKLDTDIINR